MKFSAIAVALFAMATQSAFGQTVLMVRPPVKSVGASCTYRQVENWRGTVTDKYTETVTGASLNGYQFSKITETGTTGLIVRNLDFNDIEHDGTKYIPHTGNYRYPMYQGQVYTVVYTFENSGGHGRRAYDVKVMGEETIDTPAGRFTAIKIEYRGFVNFSTVDGINKKGTLYMVRWFLPNGCIAKIEFRGSDARGALLDTTTTTLVAFSD